MGLSQTSSKASFPPFAEFNVLAETESLGMHMHLPRLTTHHPALWPTAHLKMQNPQDGHGGS